MKHYYFLAPLLPPLKWGIAPEIAFSDVKLHVFENVVQEDSLKVRKLLSFNDVTNIRQLLLEESIDSKGLLSEQELDEALVVKEGLPECVLDFLDEFESAQERIRYFSRVISQFFVDEIPRVDGFLKQYFTFEREWRLVMLGLRSKQAGRDLVRELQFEDPLDPLVAQILSQRDAEKYEPPAEYAELKELMHAASPDPLEEFRAFAAYRMKKIEEMGENTPFSIDGILSYMARLMILEEHEQMSLEAGQMMLSSIGGI